MKLITKNQLAIAIATLTLTACGGGGGGNDSSSSASNSSNNTSTASVQGVAADGYLVSAKACFDLNDNKKCDANEPSTDTTTGGKFTITGIKEADKDKHGVVIEVTAETVDEDTGKAVGKTYTMTAPPGKPEFVSPITTMVHTKMEKDGSSIEDATKLVKQDMGFTQDDSIDLFDDYVAKEKDTSNSRKDDFKKIHKIAQITAKIMRDNKDKVEQAATTAGTSADDFAAEIVNLIVQKVIDQLKTIEKVADAKKDDTEFTDKDLTDGGIKEVDTTKIKDDLKKEKESRDNSKVIANLDFADLLQNQGGITNFKAETSNCASGKCDLDYISENIQVDSSSKLSQTREKFNKTTSSWESTTSKEYRSLLLTDTGFKLAKDSDSTFTISSDTVTENLVGGLSKQHVFVKTVDLSGSEIKAFLGDSGDDRADFAENNLKDKDNAKFSDGAKGFKFGTKYPADIYESPLDNDEGKCYNTDLTYVDTNSNCNSVVIVDKSVSTGSGSTGTTPPDSVMAMKAPVTDTGRVTATTLEQLTTSGTKYVQVRGMLVQLASDGSAKLFKDGSTESFASTTWKKETVNTVEMIKVKLNREAQRLDDFGGDAAPAEIIFFVDDSFVRYGAHITAGTFNLDRDHFFNSTAAKDIKDNFVAPDIKFDDPDFSGDSSTGGSTGTGDTGSTGGTPTKDKGTPTPPTTA